MMRKFLLSLLTACLPLFLVAQGNTRLSFLLEKLYDGGKSGYTMIAAHRGDWRNAPENSLQAFQNCIDQQIDIIEVDVRETKDGHIVVMHDETLDRTTNGSGKVKDIALKEIKTLRLRNPDKTISDHRVPTFAEVLTATKGMVLIQVDKWPQVLKKVLQIAEHHGSLNQLIFRSTKPAKDIKAVFGDYYRKIHYIPVINADGIRDNEKLDDYLLNLKTSTIGLAFKSDELTIFNRVDEIHNSGIRLWYNALPGVKFNAGRDDEMALTNLENSYGWLLKKGADVIMTDRPFLLLNYLKSKNRR